MATTEMTTNPQAQALPEVRTEATGNAETYLRGRYGAYRGHFAWRELEEAFNAGVASQAVQGAESQMCLPDGIRYKLAALDLTGHQVMHLAAMAKAADSLDAVWFIKELPEGRDTDGEKVSAGIGALTKGQPGWALLSATPPVEVREAMSEHELSELFTAAGYLGSTGRMRTIHDAVLAAYGINPPYGRAEKVKAGGPDFEPSVQGLGFRCTACGKPYKPSTAIAPHAAAVLGSRGFTSSTCECGGNSFTNASPTHGITAAAKGE